MLVWMCSAHVNQRSSKNCIIPLGVGAARGDYIGLGFLTQTGPQSTQDFGPYSFSGCGCQLGCRDATVGVRENFGRSIFVSPNFFCDN